MTDDNKKVLFTIIATMLSTIVSFGLNSKMAKIAFALIFFLICFLELSNFLSCKKKKKKIVIYGLSGIEFLLILFSVLNVGSLSGYLAHMKNFFVVPYVASSENVMSFDEDFKSYFQTLSGQIEEIDKKIENSSNNLERMDNNLNIVADKFNNIHFNENINETEINEIVQLIEKKYEKHSDSFANLKTDMYSIEIMYKSTISEIPYYYCNILKAFDNYGINTDKLGITENILFLWDLERLYMTYNMKNSIVNESESDEIISKKIFYYDDYKIELNRFSDTLDYGDWHRYFTDTTPKDMNVEFNKSIMSFYQKFIINFSTE